MTMPPLPRALCRDDTVHDADYYTADQMHAYARAYAAQRVAPLVDALVYVLPGIQAMCWDTERIDAALAAEQEKSNG